MVTERELERRRDDIEQRLRMLELWREGAELRFEKLTSELRDNTLMTASVKADTTTLINGTRELLELFTASKVSLRVIKWTAGFVVSVGGAWAAAWAAWKHLP